MLEPSSAEVALTRGQVTKLQWRYRMWAIVMGIFKMLTWASPVVLLALGVSVVRTGQFTSAAWITGAAVAAAGAVSFALERMCTDQLDKLSEKIPLDKPHRTSR